MHESLGVMHELYPNSPKPTIPERFTLVFQHDDDGDAELSVVSFDGEHAGIYTHDEPVRQVALPGVEPAGVIWSVSLEEDTSRPVVAARLFERDLSDDEVASLEPWQAVLAARK